MTRTVLCRKYREELEGLDAPPYPGSKGEDIFANISKRAWNDWLTQQTMLINEKQLSLINKDDRQYLAQQMDKFFAGEGYDQIEGYVPPTPEK